MQAEFPIAFPLRVIEELTEHGLVRKARVLPAVFDDIHRLVPGHRRLDEQKHALEASTFITNPCDGGVPAAVGVPLAANVVDRTDCIDDALRHVAPRRVVDRPPVEPSRGMCPRPIDCIRCPTIPVLGDNRTCSMPTSTITEMKCGAYTVVCMSFVQRRF